MRTFYAVTLFERDFGKRSFEIECGCNLTNWGLGFHLVVNGLEYFVIQVGPLWISATYW